MHMKLMNCKFIAYIPFLITSFCSCKTPAVSSNQFENDFIDPPIENRPIAMWPWLNGYVDTVKLVHELEEVHDKGMQGLFIWDVGALADPQKIIPAGPAFLGPESLGYISIALNTAKRLGLNLGLMTSSSWNAGGPWVDTADAIMQLLSTSQIVDGSSTKRISILPPKIKKEQFNQYKLLGSVAFPFDEKRTIDLNGEKYTSLDRLTIDDKYIAWEVPKGKWTIVSFFMGNTGQPLVCPSPNSNGLMIDHLSKKATLHYFDTILAKINTITNGEARLKYFELDSYELSWTKDWTPTFIEEFKNQYGYDPVKYLPLLEGFTSVDSIVDMRFRADYSRLVSDLIIKNHFAQSVEMAERNKIKMFIEGGHGGHARVDALKALGNSHVPMGEFWNRKQHWVTKEAASAAHIYGLNLVAAESLTGWQNWQQGPADFKQLIDIAFCEGLNQVVFHTFTHNPAIAGKPGFAYHAGEHINVNTTWWPFARPFMDYISRCSYLLRQGNFEADVCLYYGDQAPNQVHPDRIDPNISPLYDNEHCLHCGRLKSVNPGNLIGYDYDYMNADIIINRLKVENGRFVLPSGQSYRVMVLPDKKEISLEVLRKLDTLISQGGIVIGPRPERSSSLKDFPKCDQEVQVLAKKIWGTCDGRTVFSSAYGSGRVFWGKTVKEILEELSINADVEVSGTDNTDGHIDYVHRKTSTEEIYFVSNSSTDRQEIRCTFRVDNSMHPEIWDAETGSIQRNLNFERNSKGVSLPLHLDPAGSKFVVFRKNLSFKNTVSLNYDLQFGITAGAIISPRYTTKDISSTWKLSFDPRMVKNTQFTLENLVSWTDITDKHINNYSGMATYEKEIILTKEEVSNTKSAFVLFENIQEMARVYVNGKDCGIIWTHPFKAEISKHLKSGVNTIKIEVVNTWNNRIVGDLSSPDLGQYSQTNLKYKFKQNSPLLPSGIIGKAQIVIQRK